MAEVRMREAACRAQCPYMYAIVHILTYIRSATYTASQVNCFQLKITRLTMQLKKAACFLASASEMFSAASVESGCADLSSL